MNGFGLPDLQILIAIEIPISPIILQNLTTGDAIGSIVAEISGMTIHLVLRDHPDLHQDTMIMNLVPRPTALEKLLLFRRVLSPGGLWVIEVEMIPWIPKILQRTVYTVPIHITRADVSQSITAVQMVAESIIRIILREVGIEMIIIAVTACDE